MANKYYVVAEATSTSGGPETLHQFAYQLDKYGCDVYVYYIDNINALTPNKFDKYNVKTTNSIEDTSDNILIVPESYTDFLHNFKNIKKCILWLSLDFYLLTLPWNRTVDTCKRHNIPTFLSPAMYVILWISGRLRHNIYKFKRKDGYIFHLYNCQYVKEYLEEHNVSEEQMLYLCGPLRDEYFNQVIDINAKEDIVLYNPKKGFEFTKKIISRCEKLNKTYKFVPIQNMSPDQIIDLMKKSKLYIDFGFFPGPERIPREAVMLKCNIITSNIGSAANSQDVLVSNKYKFGAFDKNIDSIINTMDELINDYTMHVNEYDSYRSKVIEQKKLFELNAKLFIERMN